MDASGADADECVQGGLNPVNAYGETVWSRPSLLRSSLCECGVAPTGAASREFRGGDGGKQEFVSGESAHKPSDHCAGKAGCSAALYRSCALRVHHTCTGVLRVPAGTRPSLRPFFREGVMRSAKLGRNTPREREGVSAV